MLKIEHFSTVLLKIHLTQYLFHTILIAHLYTIRQLSTDVNNLHFNEALQPFFISR